MSSNQMSFPKFLCWMLALAVLPSLCTADELQIEGASKWATFAPEGGQEEHFALSLLPSHNGTYPRPEGLEVAILFDTSASQTGEIRRDALEVLDELAKTLPENCSVSLLACDLDTVRMSEGLVGARSDAFKAAVNQLKKRIPLGATNLSKALKTANAQFTKDAPATQKTIIYIGDGVNRSHLLNSVEHQQLVKEMVESRVSITSLATGPFVDVPTLAAFANHTGGLLLSRKAIEESAQEVGRALGLSVAMPVIWVEKAEMPKALAAHFPAKFPPLRIERDTVIVGKHQDVAEQGEIKLTSSIAGKPAVLSFKAVPEISNPDMGFLTAIVSSAEKDSGLTLPTLGSAGLREMSLMLADTSTEMVKSGRFALKSGDAQSALQIAEEALKSDPNNAEAISLRKRAGTLSRRSS